MESRWMNVAVHEAMLMHVSNSTCQLSEDQEKSWSGKVCLAKLLPKDEVLWTFRFEHDGIQVSHVFVRLLDVQNVWMRRDAGNQLCHLECK